MITIFTPTYNRAYIIKVLYNSLCRQTCTDFEWLVVDDGSTDNTEELINNFISENKITIRYIKQTNGGKHRAINRGVKEAKGELFFIVDSDDYLTENAIEIIKAQYQKVKFNPEIGGVCGLKAYSSFKKVGEEESWREIECNSMDARLKYHMKGDMAEAFRTDVLREYPFPEIKDERFCPESLVWNRIAQKYSLLYFYEKIYICDYLPDGLTAKITKLRMQNAEASMMHYAELFSYKIPLVHKIKAAINYWRFACCSNISFNIKINQIGILSLPFYFVGLLMHINDKK